MNSEVAKLINKLSSLCDEKKKAKRTLTQQWKKTPQSLRQPLYDAMRKEFMKLMADAIKTKNT